MFWDGTRWIDERRQGATVTPKHRTHDRRPVVLVIIALIALSVPFTLLSAEPTSAAALTTKWKADYKVTAVQEGSPKIHYKGKWFTTKHRGYSNDRARSSNAKSASATMKFQGTGIGWAGPKGPTRGKAKVYVDGKLVKTVNLWQRRYDPDNNLFQKTWGSVGSHTIKIVVVGTAGHPTVAIDALVIRGAAKVKAASDTAGQPAGQQPEPSPEPVPSDAPDDPAPSPDGDPSPSPAPATPSALTVSGVSVSDVTQTSATIQWTVSENATGQVEYGKTTAYGSMSTPEDSFDYATHAQDLSGLTAGTTYHFRVHSVDQEGAEAYSSDRTFTTTAAAATPTPPAATPTPPAATPTPPVATPTPPVATPTPPAATPTPPAATPPPPSGASTVYGSAVGMDSLNNVPIKTGEGAYRFRAATTAVLSSVTMYVMTADQSGYGGGTGGRWQVSIQTSNGIYPSGNVLATTTYTPSVSKAQAPISWPNSPTLSAGSLYHIVFKNIDASPSTNWASLNGLFMYHPTTPRQPRFPDTEWGQESRPAGGSWADVSNTVPLMSVTYANGATQGLGYIEPKLGSHRSISGTSQIRQSMTPTKSISFSSLNVRLVRASGSSPLVLTVATAAGGTVASCTIPASSIPVGQTGRGIDSTWVSCSDSGTLAAGSTYYLAVTTASGTTYDTYPIQQGSSYGYAASTYFADGGAQYTSNGSSWSNWTDASHDIQFYLR